MNSAIIFIKNEYELNLAKSFILGKLLIEYTLRELNRLDLDKIYLCGAFDDWFLFCDSHCVFWLCFN